MRESKGVTQATIEKKKKFIPGNLQKHPGNIMEKSWNFVITEKWEP